VGAAVSVDWTGVGVALLLSGLLGPVLVWALCRSVAEEPAEDFMADPVGFVDWDLELEWLLWDEGVWVELLTVPASDEDLLDLADVVGVRR
jgi:hypothetical protein